MTLHRATDALLVIDIQSDFCPGGPMEVAGGDEIITGVGQLATQFDTIVLAQDWHPAGHASFAAQHDQAPYSTTTLPYGEQTLWPNHCVQGTPGADFHPELYACGVVDRASAIIRKGMNPHIDSYSAFFENDQATATGLGAYLRDKGITRVFVVGLAYDFCVGFTALDARKLGFEATVVTDLTRAIAMPLAQGTSVDAIERKWERAGVARVAAAELLEQADRPRRTARI